MRLDWGICFEDLSKIVLQLAVYESMTCRQAEALTIEATQVDEVKKADFLVEVVK